jgi:hypothetical protein
MDGSRRLAVVAREPEPDERYIFEFEAVRERGIHMLGVREPLHVTWIADGETTHEAVLEPWTGIDSAPADRIIETGVNHDRY